MIKRILIFIPIILLIALLCVSWSQYQQFEHERARLESICVASADFVVNCFKTYEANQDDSYYTRGIAEFRAYMQTYLSLINEDNVSGYLRCESLYIELINNPDKVKAHIPELINVFSYLKSDFNHPDGFKMLEELIKQLKAG